MHPTEPGYYWARLRSTFHAEPEWEIVQLASLGPAFDGRQVVRCFDDQDDDWSPDEDVLEWGPRIVPPGGVEAFPGVSADELLRRLRACPRCGERG